MRAPASGNSASSDSSSEKSSGIPQGDDAFYRALIAQARELDARQREKMSALGRLAAGVAHDYNNLLTVILGHVDLMMSAPDMYAVADSAAEIRATVFRGAQLARQLMAFSQRTPVTMLEIDLNRVITAAQPMLRRVVGDQVTLQMQLDARAPVISADVAQLELVLSELAANARDAMAAGGVLRVSTRSVEEDATIGTGERVRWGCISVADTGMGMDDETRARLFEPFFTTKPPGGKGLGLAAVHGIVTQAGGRLLVRSAPGRGTTVDIIFPAR